MDCEDLRFAGGCISSRILRLLDGSLVWLVVLDDRQSEMRKG